MKDTIFCDSLTSFEEIYDIWLELGKEYSPPLHERNANFNAYIEKIQLYGETYVIREGETLLGAISFYNNDIISNVAFITQICTSSKYRKRGIGTLLLQKCEERARENGMKILRLEVKKSNTQAMEFYQKNGFVKEERESSSSYFLKKIL